jgi:hypothetical protein
MITGEASPHATYDHCFVEYFKQMGVVNYQWIKLADIGIGGNGHFLFLEENNLEIARAIGRLLKKFDGGLAAPGHPALPVAVK